MNIGYWILGIGYWVLGIRYWILDIGYWILINNMDFPRGDGDDGDDCDGDGDDGDDGDGDGDDDDDGDDDGGRILQPHPSPIPLRPGIKYPVRV